MIVVHCDSQSAIHLIKDSMHHERTKHIIVKYHSIREVIAQDNMVVIKISTKDNPIDMMIKLIPVAKFDLCSDLVGLCIT